MTDLKRQGTSLTLAEEMAFREWMRLIGHTRENGFFVDDNFNGENYDYRGYFKKYGPVNLGATEHLTDEFKLPTHPTFSRESIYAVGADMNRAGMWEGETYIPSGIPSNALQAKKAGEQLLNALIAPPSGVPNPKAMILQNLLRGRLR